MPIVLDNLSRDDVREIIKELRYIGFDEADRREVVAKIEDREDDFEINNYRFIHEDKIDDIMTEELESDAYMLGCFNASFIAPFLGCDASSVEKMQKADCYEAIGEMLLAKDAVSGPHGMAAEYAAADGYGHHFSPYDGNEIEIGKYHVFRLN